MELILWQWRWQGEAMHKLLYLRVGRLRLLDLRS